MGPADAHVVAAAIALGADVLVTGDRQHFAAVMRDDVATIRVRTPRAFLLEGPG